MPLVFNIPWIEEPGGVVDRHLGRSGVAYHGSPGYALVRPRRPVAKGGPNIPWWTSDAPTQQPGWVLLSHPVIIDAVHLSSVSPSTVTASVTTHILLHKAD